MPPSKSDLPTPALIVDLQRLDENIRRMQTAVSKAGKILRPHAKAHKCAEIAKRQAAAGASGFCAATLPEAELIASAGFGVLLTTPVGSRVKFDRVAVLARGGADIRVVVDHAAQASGYQESAAREGVVLDVLVDLDVGDHRTGVPCDERAVALAERVSTLRNLRLSGIQAYSVRGSHTQGREARKLHSQQALALAAEIRSELTRRGMNVPVVTGGSTGTWDIDIAIDHLTEMQCGSYCLMDSAYRRIGGIDFAAAMTVLATVVSANHEDRVTVDAGFKAFATDRPFGPEPVGVAGAEWHWGGDEHGILKFDGPHQLRVGDRIEFIPPHCDPTVNLYDRLFVCTGETLEAVWPLKRLALHTPPIACPIDVTRS